MQGFVSHGPDVHKTRLCRASMSSHLMLSLVLSYVNMALCLPPYPVYSADAGSESSSQPGSLGEGEKRAWYLLFAHALNYLSFQSF